MDMRKLPAACCLVFCAASSGVAQAASTDIALSERDYFEELPIVLSVSRLAQPLGEAPGAVTVIDREMIRQSGVRQVVDLLRLVPGFQVASLPRVSGPPVAVYHGLAEPYPRHMQVLIDGRSQYSPFFVGGVNWDLVPVSIDDIDRIEVMRGSNSAAFGANAVLGVVNIVTRHTQETVGAAAEMHSGMYGINDKYIRLGADGQDFSVRYTGESRADTGFANFRDDGRQRLNSLRADWRLGSRDELQLQAGEVITSQQEGSGDLTDPFREQRFSQQYVQLGWRRTLSESEEFAVRYYRSEEKAVDSFSFDIPIIARVPPPPRFVGLFTVPVNYGFRSKRDDIEATHTFSPWADTRLIWGGELRFDAVNGPLYYGRADDVSETMSRLFGNLEWRASPAWIANVGANWERDSKSGTTFAPRLAMNWHAAPGQTLRTVVTRAYRTPSLFETAANYTFSSTTGIPLDRRVLAVNGARPESITSSEIGWVGEFKPVRLSGDVRVFDERLSDRLVAIPTALSPPNCEAIATLGCAAVDSFFNAQDVHIRGIEHQWRWQPAEATRLIFNQSFIRISANAKLPAANVSPEYRLEKDIIQTNNSAPTRASSFMLMQRLPGGIDLAAIYQTSGAMKWGNNTYAPAWHRLDWRIAYPFRAGPTRGEVAFTVQGDGSRHIEHADNNSNPARSEFTSTRSYVTLRLQY